MPEPQTPPADGQQGSGEPGNQPAAGQPTPPQKPERTFTQSELDAIVQDRIARAKPADYDEAKAALQREKEREEGEKTELQKAQDAAAEAARERDEAKQTAARERLAARIEVEAARQGADSDLVLAVLGQQADLKLDDVKSAVEKLLEDKPHLKLNGVPRKQGGEFGGQGHQTIAEEIAALEAKGDRDSLAQARRLKTGQALGIIK